MKFGFENIFGPAESNIENSDDANIGAELSKAREVVKLENKKLEQYKKRTDEVNLLLNGLNTEEEKEPLFKEREILARAVFDSTEEIDIAEEYINAMSDSLRKDIFGAGKDEELPIQ